MWPGFRLVEIVRLAQGWWRRRFEKSFEDFFELTVIPAIERLLMDRFDPGLRPLVKSEVGLGAADIASENHALGSITMKLVISKVGRKPRSCQHTISAVRLRGESVRPVGARLTPGLPSPCGGPGPWRRRLPETRSSRLH